MKTTDKLLNRICLDERIQDGTFQMENDSHMDILQEYLEKYGLTKEEAAGVRNSMLEGKFPERQAYNKNGLLVTFPTPEYKKRAIDRGTHFEKDTTKKAPNISFDGTATGTPATPAAAPTTPTTPTPQATTKPTGDEPSKLAPAEPTAPPTPTPDTGTTTGTSTNVSPTTGTDVKPAPQPLDVVTPNPTPTPMPTTPASTPQTPIEPTKTPEQIKAEGEYVERLLKTEITLDEAKFNGWKRTFQNQWYDKNGKIVGNTIFDDKRNMQIVQLI